MGFVFVSAGYVSLASGQANEYIGSGSGRANEYFSSWFALVNECLRNTNDACETIQMELEKETIREKNIMAEIRRQILDAEVMREKTFERELALPARGGGAFDRFSYQLEVGMGFQPREVPFQQGKGRSLEERIIMSIDKGVGMGARHETGGFETVPFQRESVEPRIKEVMRAPLGVGNDKDKIVIMVSMYYSVSHTSKVYTATSESQGTFFVGFITMCL